MGKNGGKRSANMYAEGLNSFQTQVIKRFSFTVNKNTLCPFFFNPLMVCNTWILYPSLLLNPVRGRQ